VIKPTFHEIRVKAFELWIEAVSTNGVDFGPWFFWFEAEAVLGIGNPPLPPPIK